MDFSFPRALKETIAALWTPPHAAEIPHFLFLLVVLKKELESLAQCRRLLKPKASKATPQESQFCKELKVNQPTLLQGWSKGGVTWELGLTPGNKENFSGRGFVFPLGV